MVKTHAHQSTPWGKACVGNEMIEKRKKSVWGHTLWRADNQLTPETCLSEFSGAYSGLGALWEVVLALEMRASTVCLH